MNKKLEIKNQARHGDLLLVRVDDRPINEIGKDKMILAEGSATGHKHLFKGKGVRFFKNNQGTIYIEVPKKAMLSHEEHATIHFNKGIYKLIKQIEYGPDEQAKEVQD